MKQVFKYLKNIFIFLVAIPILVQLVGTLLSLLWPQRILQQKNLGTFSTPSEWVNPYASAPLSNWLKANLHSHSARYEGSFTEVEMAIDYSNRGYDVLAISDHMLLPRSFDNPRDILILPAYEFGINFSRIHFNVFNPKQIRFDFFPIWPTLKGLDWISKKLSSDGDFLVFNHPACSQYVPITEDTILSMPAIDAMELSVNWICSRPDRGSEALWDKVLTRGRMLWGVAGDDAHNQHHTGIGFSLIPSEKKISSILENLSQGRNISVSGRDPGTPIVPLTVITSDQEFRIELSKPASTLRIIGPAGIILKEAKGESTLEIETKALQPYSYVRWEYWNGDNRYFLNPIFRPERFIQKAPR